MKQSSGTLLYRFDDRGQLEVLLVHPSGGYNRRAPWGIPKGLPDEGESLEEAARRETLVVADVHAFPGHGRLPNEIACQQIARGYDAIRTLPRRILLSVVADLVRLTRGGQPPLGMITVCPADRMST